MRDAQRPPIAHLILLAVLGLAFLIGGNVTFQDWGRLAVRPLTGYLATAVVLHGASRFVEQASLYVRAAAWLLVALMPLHLDVLLRAEVLVPVVALAAVDLAQHHTQVETEFGLPAGALAKGIAGMATVAFLAILAVLVPLARTPLVLFRLGLVSAVAWALVSGFALRPPIRTPVNLLAGAGAFAVTFALLAGPVLPLGPLMTYWATIVAVAAAVLTATFTRSELAFRDEHRVHEQTIRSLPDPVLEPLAHRIHTYVHEGEGAEELDRRIREAHSPEDPGEAIEERAQRWAQQGLGPRTARRRALAEALGVDIDTVGGSRA